jgi:hypothetical protein
MVERSAQPLMVCNSKIITFQFLPPKTQYLKLIC